MKEICFGKVVELKKKKKQVLQKSSLENQTHSRWTVATGVEDMHAATELVQHTNNFLFIIKYLY